MRRYGNQRLLSLMVKPNAIVVLADSWAIELMRVNEPEVAGER